MYQCFLSGPASYSWGSGEDISSQGPINKLEYYAFLQVPEKQPGYSQMQDNWNEPVYWDQKKELSEKERRLISSWVKGM